MKLSLQAFKDLSIKDGMAIAISTSKKWSPQILTAIGIVGFGLSVTEAVRATPKAMALIEAEEERLERELTTKEVIKLCWKCYIKTACMAGVTVSCILGANHIHTKRNAALVAAYSMVKDHLDDIEEAIHDELGDDKSDDILAKAKEKRTKTSKNESGETVYSVPEEANIIKTHGGVDLCFDKWSGRFFYSSIAALDRADAQFNKNQLNGWYDNSVNILYDAMDLPNIPAGEVMGWDINDNGDVVHLVYGSIITDDGRPCISVDFDIEPSAIL